MMNATQFRQMVYDINNLGTTYLPANGNNGATFPNSTTYSWYKDSEGGFYGYSAAPKDTGYDTNWQNIMMRNAPSQTYSLNVSGGDDKGTFSLMGNFFNQEGIIIHSGVQKASGRFNFSRKIYNNATLNLNFSGYHQMQTGWASTSSQASGVIMNMLAQPPTKNKYDNSGAADNSGDDSGTTPENNNPWYQATYITKNTSRDNFQFRGSLDWYLIPSVLRLNVALNYSKIYNMTKLFYPSDVAQGVNYNGLAQNNTLNNSDFTSENLLYWTPKLSNNDFQLDAMGGMTAERQVHNGLNTETDGFDLQNLGYNSMQEGAINANIATTSPYDVKTLSFLGRANLNYKQRYLFTATMRADASSNFGVHHRWGYFPSAAVGWRASEENFLKPVRALSNLKVRASWGITGNANIPPLQSKNAMDVAPYPFNGSDEVVGHYTMRSANPDLKWESSIQTNAGLDFGFWNNRLSGTVDLYLKQTRDLLMQMPVLASTGYTTQWSNIAAVNNKGLEITLSGICVKTKLFQWTSDFNMAFNRSLVKNIGGAPSMILNPSGSYGGLSNFAILQVGQPIGTWYGYQTNGLYRLQSQIDALPDGYVQLGTVKTNIYPGYQRFVDQNGDNKINASDRVILGSAEPKFIGGFNNSFMYSNFTLSVGLEFRYGSQIFNGTARYLSELRSTGRNQLASAADYWRPTLFDTHSGQMVDPGNELSTQRRPNGPQQMYCLDLNVEDGSYLRINSISLKYQIPSKLLRKVGFSACSFFFSVDNVWILTKYTGYDPDVNVVTGTYSDLVPGFDFAAYPRARSYTFGMNFNF